ncbi:LutC/YkgG family protein [Lihuaxuella thermophila]|uniref:L-lactate dehydrogenase complex protein LldG n=1 Tax=Lihuaxuella thermophila TaxID=1173111 RepID=A0A1H8EX12_9BACL|nr:LUD domain-containing protein [Lihuaxuella thermophila]SEN23437.1 L-lactate dehydrogenase complex protein LldG [Lihuaxuella thermophila]
MSLKENREIIAELDRESKQKEAVFIARIAQRLGHSRVQTAPHRNVRGVPEFWKDYHLEKPERISLFMKNWESLGGTARRFSTSDDLTSYIQQVAFKLQAKRMIRWGHPFLDHIGIDEKLKDMENIVWEIRNKSGLLIGAAGADLGIVVADYAIAHTGTIVVVSSATKGRSVSLLPTALMVIVRTKDIKTKMGEVLSEIQQGREMPAGIHFITGPSRSADIENDLTIGVHGPGIVYALIID